MKPDTLKSFIPPSIGQTKRVRTVSTALNEISVIKEPVTNFYKIGKIIGDGKFGTVREAYHLEFPEQPLAIKTIKLRNITDPESLMQEISALRQVDHPNIVKILETYRDDKHLNIVME